MLNAIRTILHGIIAITDHTVLVWEGEQTGDIQRRANWKFDRSLFRDRLVVQS